MHFGMMLGTIPLCETDAKADCPRVINFSDMKRLALFILVLGAAMTAQAHHPKHHNYRGYSSARIYADGPFEIQVAINGYLVNGRPGQWVDLGHLPPGRYVIGIRAYGPQRTKYTKQVIHIRRGYRTEYAVYSNSRRSPLLLSREAMIPIGRPIVYQDYSRRGRY